MWRKDRFQRKEVRCGGASSSRAPLAATDENNSTNTGSAWGGRLTSLSEEKGDLAFSLNGLLLSLACIGMHIKENKYGLQIMLLGSGQSF